MRLISLLFFFPRPTATVALTPAIKTLNNTTTTSVATRALSSAQQGSQTGVPTGPRQLGTHAGGVLSFKNYTPDWVTIPEGTIVPNVTGQQVATDATIRVPPDPIIPGVASVHATTVNVGKSGNIQALSINKSCCFAGIYVLNASVFSGGMDNQAGYSVLQAPTSC